MLLQPFLILSKAYHAHAPAMQSQYASNCATTCPPSPILTLPQDPQDMPPMLPPNFHPNPSLRFHTPAAYHAYAPAANPCLPSPILRLLHPRRLECSLTIELI
ncbi:hypothetical protein O181_013228 [Austropuccinia psidii MF-1]|uniref:Uncharacterized protein n=1 Tax=Austropuccinia psidii MF-1 TaxID=1389203 RepID=A0A9Q3GMW9_9BASI|nr:hypothetical protein [Austropuccinia psidii MF-1]